MVSIILPVYNREEYIEECIESLWAQTYQDFEIIIINDGSTDNTLNVCNELAKKDHRIYVYNIEHNGVSNARNVGIAAAKGEYIFFIDSDDAIHPFLIKGLLDGLNDKSADIACIPLVGLYQNDWARIKEMMDKDQSPCEIKYKTNEESLYDLFYNQFSLLNGIGGVMMRRSLIGNTLFNADLIFGEDYYFIYQNLIKGADTVFLNRPWYYRREHENNSYRNYNLDGFWSRIYKKVLVWQSEEKMGRKHYANLQKNDAFSLYLYFVNQKYLTPEDAKKANQAIRTYAKELLPGLSIINKVRFVLYIYVPGGLRFLYPAEIRLKKLVRKVWPKNKRSSAIS